MHAQVFAGVPARPLAVSQPARAVGTHPTAPPRPTHVKSPRAMSDVGRSAGHGTPAQPHAAWTTTLIWVMAPRHAPRGGRGGASTVQCVGVGRPRLHCISLRWFPFLVKLSPLSVDTHLCGVTDSVASWSVRGGRALSARNRYKHRAKRSERRSMYTLRHHAWSVPSLPTHAIAGGAVRAAKPKSTEANPISISAPGSRNLRRPSTGSRDRSDTSRCTRMCQCQC